MSFGCDCVTIWRSRASGGAVGQGPTQAESVAVCVEDGRRQPFRREPMPHASAPSNPDLVATSRNRHRSAWTEIRPMRPRTRLALHRVSRRCQRCIRPAVIPDRSRSAKAITRARLILPRAPSRPPSYMKWDRSLVACRVWRTRKDLVRDLAATAIFEALPSLTVRDDGRS